MPGRFPGERPNVEGKHWSIALSRHLQSVLGKLFGGMEILQKAPRTPTSIEAGLTASIGDDPHPAPPALDDHQHDILTAAPTNPTGQTASEGTGAAMMRASATIKQGIVTTKGDLLTHHATLPERLPVGSDGAQLFADSTETTGLRWGPSTLEDEITANVNDYAPDIAQTLYLEPDNNWSITGMVAGYDGEIRYLINVSATGKILTLPHADGGSLPANRFVCPGSVPLVLNPGDMAMAIYDATRLRWRAFEHVGGFDALAGGGADPGWVQFWGPPYYSQAPG